MTDASLPPDSDVLAKAKELRERVLNNGLVPVMHDPLLEDDDPIVDAVMRVVDGLIEEVERQRVVLDEIATLARKGKVEVEGVTIDQPVWVCPNVAIHWLSIIRTKAGGRDD